jgi:hypothetical protein
MGYRLRGCDQASLLLYAISSPDLNESQAAFVASLLVYPLPKIVRQHADQNGLHPIADNDGYLNAVAVVAPKWARRVRRRIAYGLARRRKAK